MTAAFNAGSQLISSVATPVSGTDAANKSYVDASIHGFTQKPTVRLATTTTLPAYTYNNGSSGVGATLTATGTTALSIDGVAVAVADLVLVKNETGGNAPYNGIYVVTATGGSGAHYVLTRSTYMDSPIDFEGALVPVDNEGTTNANTLWLSANVEAGYVVGTTNVAFTQIAGPGTYLPGNGISISGTTISVNNGNGLNFSGSSLQVKADVTSTGNTATVITVGTNGVGVAIDNATIAMNGSSQLYIPNLGIGTAQLAATSVTTAKIANAAVGPTQLAAQAGGTGLQGGNGSNLAILRATRETPTGTINGSNTAFTLAHTPVSGTEEVYKNGLLQDAGGNDYSISTVTITFTAAPVSGDTIRVTYFY